MSKKDPTTKIYYIQSYLAFLSEVIFKAIAEAQEKIQPQKFIIRRLNLYFYQRLFPRLRLVTSWSSRGL